MQIDRGMDIFAMLAHCWAFFFATIEGGESRHWRNDVGQNRQIENSSATQKLAIFSCEICLSKSDKTSELLVFLFRESWPKSKPLP
jgi:hypothetical protein